VAKARKKKKAAKKSKRLKKVRVAMIGAGGMANRVHYPSLASFKDVEIAAICDLNEERLNTTSDKYGVEARYTDYKKMCEEIAPDAVYVVGPPDDMYKIWVWCLQQGLNMFVEKPLGITAHQARMLAVLAEENKCITQVGFQRRTCPMVVKLRNKCLERGPMVHAVCRFYKSAIKPYTGSLSHMMGDGVHAIDTVRWMCGGEVVNIQSLTRSVGVPDVNWFTIMLEFDNGATGIVINSHASGRRIFDVEMHAPGICAEAEHEGKGYLYADGDKNREFIDCLKSGKKPGSHFADAVKTMEVADRVLAQGLLRG